MRRGAPVCASRRFTDVAEGNAPRLLPARGRGTLRFKNTSKANLSRLGELMNLWLLLHAHRDYQRNSLGVE